MRARFLFQRLVSGVARLVVLIVLLLLLCQFSLWLHSGQAGRTAVVPVAAASFESVAPGAVDAPGTALGLAWSIVSGAERRPVDEEAGNPGRAVLAVVLAHAGETLWVVGLAVLLILGIGLPLGILRGRSRRNPLAWLLSAPLAVGVCLPVFWLAAVAAWWMLDHRGLPLPAGDTGGFDIVVTGTPLWLAEHWPGLVIAVLAALTGTGWLMRSISGGIQHAAQADHLWVGRMRGMGEAQLFHRHTLRNALKPMLMSVANLLPFVFGAVILGEGVMHYPGLGGLVFEAGLSADFAVLLAACTMMASLVLATRVVGEMALGLADPRFRSEGGEA